MKAAENGEIIQTNHPEKKKGIRMSKVLYNSIAEFIAEEIKNNERTTLAQLLIRQNDVFSDSKHIDMNWFIYHVKIDLETKGMITSVYNDRLKISEIRFTSVGIKSLLQYKPDRKPGLIIRRPAIVEYCCWQSFRLLKFL